MKITFLQEMKNRGYLNQCTDIDKLSNAIDNCKKIFNVNNSLEFN